MGPVYWRNRYKTNKNLTKRVNETSIFSRCPFCQKQRNNCRCATQPAIYTKSKSCSEVQATQSQKPKKYLLRYKQEPPKLLDLEKDMEQNCNSDLKQYLYFDNQDDLFHYYFGV